MSMATTPSVFHDTIVMQRTYRASPARVFEAWRSVEARQRWSRPSPDVEFVYEQHDFRVGGLDIARCGSPGDLRYCAEVRYMEIASDARIVFSERVTEDGLPRAAALIDVSMEAKGRDTHMVVTMHVAAFDTPEMLQGYRDGWTPTLDNLANEF
jgi:uncharacterized protein YndB with AHSA1/START domain